MAVTVKVTLAPAVTVWLAGWPVMAGAMIAYAFADRILIDGLVEGVAKGVKRTGAWFSDMQTGDAGWYGTLVGLGAVVVIALSIWMGR